MRIADEELNQMTYEELVDLADRIRILKKQKYNTSETRQTQRFNYCLERTLKQIEENKNNERYDADVISNIYEDIKYILKIKEETLK